ncbi:NUMOD4 domain-containing protein [Klebsiella pneumoniae]|uniref:HNH endonuclease n=1 Tax=Klebsiella pneumoniae TaxID=573 RepID=UPI002841DB8B|nr:NUMOD4 domain-containing protein [Klebsiella pneumoniae]MDR4579267.1 NUMOD4 domain-containing protein [Klebsiella pneumoniae]
MKFLPVVGWEGIYQVNECGDVISLPRVILRRDGTKQRFNGGPLKQFLNTNGYCVVRLSDASNGRREIARVHRLVAEAFLPNPYGKPEVNHIDGNKANPHLINLEWVTPQENRKHAWETGLRNRSHLPAHKGEMQANSKLNNQSVSEIRMLRGLGASFGSLAIMFNVSKRTIRRVVSGESWSHVSLPAAPQEVSDA